jgi:glycosyltransferase involved in cell wall biosynthesis
MLISILIPTHNRSAQLRRTLESLRSVAVPAGVRAEIVVVANACTDDTVAVVNAESAANGGPFPTRVVEESNVGLNCARNRAMKEAAGDVLAFLDDDVWVETAWLAQMAELFETTPADIAAGTVTLWWEAVEKPAWMTTRSEHLLSCVKYGEEKIELTEPGLAVGANFAFRKTVPEKIGAFTTWLDRTGSLPLAGGDTEFLARALDAGFRMFYSPGAVVKHWVAPNRITPKYLGGVAYGAGLARSYLRKNFSAGQAFGAFFKHGFRIVSYAFLYGITRIICAKRTYIHLYIRLMTSRGNVRGAWLRWRKLTPAGKKMEPPMHVNERR